MGLFNFKKKSDPAPKPAGKELLSISQDDLDGMMAKAVADNLAKSVPAPVAPVAKEGMNNEERTQFTAHCTALGATELMNDCLNGNLTYLEASAAVNAATVSKAAELEADFNTFNPPAGPSAPPTEAKGKYTSTADALTDMVEEASSKGLNLTYKQARINLEKAQPELFLNPHLLITGAK